MKTAAWPACARLLHRVLTPNCGAVWPNKAREHYFCNDPGRNQRSIVRLAREGLLRCHPGQFGDFPGKELGRFLTTDTGEVMEFSGEPV